MIYGHDTIAEVRVQNDIVDVVGDYVKLTPRAGNHFGLCPFHNERTPSFSANRAKQIFYCFGCGAGGNVITFIMQVERLDFVDALKLLADRVHYRLPEAKISPGERQQIAEREAIAELNKRAALFYHEYLLSETPNAKSAMNYLTNRGLDLKMIRRFGIGLSPLGWDSLINHMADVDADKLVNAGLAGYKSKYFDRFRERLMFPIIDGRNRVVGFGGRIIRDDKDEAKYINTSDTLLFKKSEFLYGLNLAKKRHNGGVILTEGYTDVISMHKHGFKTTVAVLGTALTEQHVRLLKGVGVNKVTLILDNDAAGERAAERAIPIITKGGLTPLILSLPEAKDPDEFLQKFGAEKLHKLIESATGHIMFLVGLAKRKYDMETTEGKINFTKDAAKIIATQPGDIETEAYSLEVSKTAGISQVSVQAEVAKTKGITPDNTYIRPRAATRRVSNEERGVKDAKSNILHLLFTYPHAAEILQQSGIIEAGDFEGETYRSLLAFAYRAAKLPNKPTPADIMDMVKTPEERQVIAEIFSGSFESKDEREADKALSDSIKKIKHAKLDSLLASGNLDLPQIKEIGKKRREIETITLNRKG